MDHFNHDSRGLKGMQNSSQNRYLFIDYLRGFVVALVVIDHAIQAYAPHFGKYWFLPDIERHIFYDVFHMNNNSFMMPILFFLAGLFVIPSLKRRGYLDFIKERFLKLVVPFVVGVPLLAPIVSYSDYLAKQGENAEGYFSYVVNVFFASNFVQVGIFWFLYYLIAVTTVFVAIYTVFPALIRLFGRLTQWMASKPITGFIVFSAISAVILGVSDLIWGAPWFIGWGRFFHVQGSRFILLAFYFLIGMAIGEVGLLNDKDFWQRFSAKWFNWLIFTVVVGGVYIGYTLMNLSEGVYNSDVRYFFYQGGTLDEAWPLIIQAAPPVLIRTTLHGIFCAAQVLTLLAVFYRFLNHPSAPWASLAACSYGIYLIHEGFVVWLHYWLYGTEIPIIFKVALSGFGSLMVSWAIADKILLKVPVLRRVLYR
jgi:peptidoglycan/LPS O-acetylase OafA/YrhL